MTITEYVYLSLSNTNDILLKSDGEPEPLDMVTRVVLLMTDTIFVDSEVSEGAFTWTGLGVVGKMLIYLGDEDIPPGTYMGSKLILFDSVNTKGIYWENINFILKEIVIPDEPPV